MEFVAPIIEAVVGSLMVPIKKHLGFFVSFTKLVEEMRGRVQRLNVTEKEVQMKKDIADANNQVVSEHVDRWLDDVKEINKKVEGIPTDGIGCCNVAKRYKAGKMSSDIVKKIDDLEAWKSKIEWTKEQIPLGMVPSTAAPVHDGTQISFKSRDLVFNAALKSLQPDSEIQMIALSGMGGVGKTTMMEQLKKAVEESKMFDWVVKVVVGEKPDPITIQQAIAEYMGQVLTERTKDARADRLRNRFAGMARNGKKVLVIMDDLWKEVDLKDVGLMSPLPNGFKLLITSRFEYVCTKMGINSESIFTLGVLKYPEAKTLFFGIVGPSVGNDYELQKIGEGIVEKCGGLPIAIKTIADSLRDDIKDAWKDALSNLQHGNLQDLYDIVDKVFEMSYNNLKNDDAKAIFLLSGIFPDDHDIPIEELMIYGWGLKLFKEVYNIREARRRTNTCVNNLIRANLLTKSDREGCVKMHDLVRSFILSNFSNVKQASVVNHDDMARLLTKDANESYDRILLKCADMSEFPADFNYPNLSLLILTDWYKLKFPADFYERMKKLEVLSYEHKLTPLLPTTFEHSSQLRTLCLRSCWLKVDLSFLGSLSNLETLSLVDCSGIKKLPSTIGNLRKLKLLDLTNCDNLRIDDGVFQNLVRLEELYIRAYMGRAIKFTDANCAELEILSQHLFALEMEFYKSKAQPKNVSFKKLERFRISIGCTLEHNAFCKLERYIVKNTLCLLADSHKLLECKISELFEKTEELYLEVNNMNHLGVVSMHPSQHSFCNLRLLVVEKCPDMKYLFTLQVAIGLKKLERLLVDSCSLLEGLVGGNSVVSDKRVEAESERDSQPPLGFQFHNLKEIIFPNLDVLELTYLPCLKGIGRRGNMWSMSHNTSSSTATSVNNQFQGTQVISATWPLCQYPRRLTLRWCHAWSSSIIVCYVVLKDLKHRDDTQIIPSIVLLQLTKLEDIHVRENELAEEVFEVIPEGTNNNNNGGFSESQTVFNIPNLTDMLIYEMNNLRYLWKRNRWMVLEFPKLTTLKIDTCRRLEHVFTSSMVGRLVQLQELDISHCQNLELIVKEEERDVRVNDQMISLPHLKVLKLYNLPSLKGFCLGKEAFSWPSLDTLKIRSCPAITVLTKGQLDTPALKVIDTSFGKRDIREDLNSFIKTKQEEVPTCCL
ncbi:NB-ARC domains-containing protein [Artemisia annua]|uniref:NB-ARC domains-containing protein n=1 Tax=Artemisia annua TaxID=35608 RepID=A0A2U1Q4A5_ARTAN|nr:NB-ARC domains-containing protein [Artemisia annua]